MKKYKIEFTNDITKDIRSKVVVAETKAKARKEFNNMYYNPYPIISITLIKE